MIQAKELRIGNLVNYSDSNSIFKVIGISEFGIDCEDEIETTYMEFDNFNPIPLTEDWLLKFGFEKGIDKVYYIKSKFIYIKVFEKIGHVLLCRDKYDEHIKISDNIEYVHQLQNLYFAITNKELSYEN